MIGKNVNEHKKTDGLCKRKSVRRWQERNEVRSGMRWWEDIGREGGRWPSTDRWMTFWILSAIKRLPRHRLSGFRYRPSHWRAHLPFSCSLHPTQTYFLRWEASVPHGAPTVGVFTRAAGRVFLHAGCFCVWCMVVLLCVSVSVCGWKRVSYLTGMSLATRRFAVYTIWMRLLFLE